MDTLKSFLRFGFAIALAVIAVPILVWIGLAAIGAAVLAALTGSIFGAWAIHKAQKERSGVIIDHE
ncbi:hypothetical protein [Ahrensia marina]|jgi:thiol:disulfide interchange protein|uniref:Uncharacterized protein n=1 Tax=Ahrensia marina TaxID=1514904 RepID=A0A0N0E8N7_9HYPH|nr:hypothetical protein [Ahrensia marina]KPB02552.1 hypothetical protein SU32_02020 [Ahrensia marina]